MKSCVIYARVSTEKQDVSIDAQLEKGREWARLNGRTVLGEYTDVASGSKDNRVGMESAVKHACKEHAALVCYSLSRLSRSTVKSIELITQLSKSGGGGFVSLTESQLETITPNGEFMATIYASVAQLERRMIGARTATALRYMRSKGLNIYSKIPFGWDLDPKDQKRLVKNDAEHAVIAQILHMHASGLSLGKITARLNADGIATKTGKSWGRGTVYALIKRESKGAAIAA